MNPSMFHDPKPRNSSLELIGETQLAPQRALAERDPEIINCQLEPRDAKSKAPVTCAPSPTVPRTGDANEYID